MSDHSLRWPQTAGPARAPHTQIARRCQATIPPLQQILQWRHGSPYRSRRDAARPRARSGPAGPSTHKFEIVLWTAEEYRYCPNKASFYQATLYSTASSRLFELPEIPKHSFPMNRPKVLRIAPDVHPQKNTSFLYRYFLLGV